MKSAFLAKNRKRVKARPSEFVTLPAPTGGWNVSNNLANTPPATAQILENWFPTQTGIRLRGGSLTHATVSTLGLPVQSLITYTGSVLKKLFSATTTKIFDVTTVVSPTVEPAAVVSGRTSGYYSFINFTTSGGAYMVLVNGTDNLLLYDPVGGFVPITPISIPAITGVTSTGQLSFVWAYRNRLFFIERDSLRVRFLGVGAISGALGTVDLNGVFLRGGSLLFGDTWSMDAGDGLDDRIVFVTTEGEFAVFEGSNPASSAAVDWSLVGRYDISPPLGPRATMRAGGDLIIATEDGLVPISAAIAKDISALKASAVSQPIAAEWQKEAADRRDLPWEIVKWPAKSYAIMSAPVTLPGQPAISLVVNTDTGRWCKFTGWDTRCMALHDGQLFFGTNDGRVKRAEVTGTDDGAGIYYTVVGNPEHLGTRGAVKTVQQARATYVRATSFADQISASMDYQVVLPSPPSSPADGGAANSWDEGRWDSALWDVDDLPQDVQAAWSSIGLSGYVMQYQVQITGGADATPQVELVTLDFTYEMGGVVV